MVQAYGLCTWSINIYKYNSRLDNRDEDKIEVVISLSEASLGND